MTRIELWVIYCKRNPQFLDEEAKITLTARGLKKFFDQTWEEAHSQGVANGRALAAQEKPKDNGMGDLFKDMFK